MLWTPPPRPIHSIHVHHSDSHENTTMEQIRAWHVFGNGWRDIGYHCVIERTGLQRHARPIWVVGAHDGGENWGTLGVCVAGKFDGDRPKPPPAQWRSLVSWCSDMCVQFGLEASDVEGHGENEPPETPTLCPGFDMVELRIAVQKRLQEIRP